VLANLSVAVVNTVDTRPLRPRVVVGTLGGRLGQKLEVGNGLGTMTERSTNTIVTSVTTTDDNNILALGGDVGVVRKLRVKERLGVLVEEFHSVVNTIELAALDWKVAGNGSTGCNDDGAVAGSKVVERRVTLLANCNASLEDDTLRGHEVGTALDNTLIKLHVGNAVHEETSETVSSLVNSNEVTGTVELISCGQTSRTGSNDRDGLASSDLGRLRNHPSHLETAINDGALNRLNTNRVLVNTQDTSTLTRSGTNAASELREVVGHQETVESILPLVLEHQFIPFRDNVGDRAASLGLTERYTTVHTTSGLVFELVLVQARAQLSPVLETRVDRAVLLLTAFVHLEASSLVEHKGTLLLGSVVTDSLLEILELGNLLGLLVLDTRDSRKVVLSTLGFSSLGSLLLEDTLVVDGKNLDESRKGSVKVNQDASCALGASVVMMILNETTNESNLSRILETTGLNHLAVELGVEITVNIQDVGNTTRHTSSKVAASRSKNNNAATSHVLTTVVTDTFNNGGSTRVSDSETLGSNTTEEASTSSSTVQASVTNENVLLRLEDSGAGRVDDQTTARQALTNIIVGITLELKGDTRSKESTEGLTSGALDINMDSVHGQSSLAVSLGDVVRK
jgi:hypothetical protein